MLSKSAIHFKQERSILNLAMLWGTVGERLTIYHLIFPSFFISCRGIWFLCRLPQLSLLISISFFSLLLPPSLSFSLSSHHNRIFLFHISTYTQLSSDVVTPPLPWHYPTETKDTLWVAVPKSWIQESYWSRRKRHMCCSARPVISEKGHGNWGKLTYYIWVAEKQVINYI